MSSPSAKAVELVNEYFYSVVCDEQERARLLKYDAPAMKAAHAAILAFIADLERRVGEAEAVRGAVKAGLLGKCGAHGAGCGHVFVDPSESYRCLDCEVLFCKRCITEHFADSRRVAEKRTAKIIDRLSAIKTYEHETDCAIFDDGDRDCNCFQAFASEAIRLLNGEPWKLPDQNLFDELRSENARVTAERDALAARCKVLEEALRRAHDCATLKDDGTCDGCFVSAALTPRTDGGGAKEGT